jgi:hypothetical protein
MPGGPKHGGFAMGLNAIFDVILGFLEELFALIFSFVERLDSLDPDDDGDDED